jgi:hypothetical protein
MRVNANLKDSQSRSPQSEVDFRRLGSMLTSVLSMNGELNDSVQSRSGFETIPFFAIRFRNGHVRREDK